MSKSCSKTVQQSPKQQELTGSVRKHDQTRLLIGNDWDVRNYGRLIGQVSAFCSSYRDLFPDCLNFILSIYLLVFPVAGSFPWRLVPSPTFPLITAGVWWATAGCRFQCERRQLDVAFMQRFFPAVLPLLLPCRFWAPHRSQWWLC